MKRLILSLAWLLGACASGPKPCASASGCPPTLECLAARCVAQGGEPVPEATRRVQLTPLNVAVAVGTNSSGLPPAITLGRALDRQSALYLRFEPAWRQGRIQAAFLLLDQQPGSGHGPDLPLEVWRADSDWRANVFAWWAQPGFAPPFTRGIARSSPAANLRVDVTEIVRFFAAHPDNDFGFVLRAADSNSTGITLATGADGARAPRLDLYLSD